MTRDQALALVDEYVTNQNLKKHMLAVEAAMRAYAPRFNADPNQWGIVGLLHDFDYERFPSPEDHPYRGSEILRQRGWPAEIIDAVMAHASHTGTPRDSNLKKAIFAVDELAGLIVATALVRPDKKIASVDVQSVRKKMKSAGFARQIQRDEISQGAAELGVPLDDHIATVLHAMQSVANELGL